MANNKDSDLIEQAISNSLKNFDEYDENDILVEWVVVGFVSNPDKEKGDSYPMLFSNGNIPTYRALGLLHKGLELLKQE